MLRRTKLRIKHVYAPTEEKIEEEKDKFYEISEETEAKDEPRDLQDVHEPTIDVVVKARRLQWLGHIETMTEDRIPKTIAQKRPDYKKKKGRPRKRLHEMVMLDLEN
ncbi:hypothetical protein ILUMI_07566 [Ignelater luminosus]|uniref:Uncharacterized protein n=1 Tax=Ignelater luminosus TaxID=2038154 RepID=A0A8K0GBH5_IGNLU|nr:hypothetical protein ILUMI_07566 [Ignelater luminosus]